MAELNKVSIVGTGNLAWNLVHALQQANISLVEVVGRSRINIPHLAPKTRLTFTTDYESLERGTDLIILAVTDDALHTLASKIPYKDIPVIHVSGASHISILHQAGFRDYGVVYPLQTFTKTRLVSFDNIPLFVEASSHAFEQKLTKFAGHLSKHIRIFNSSDRLALHVAAVFASNFSNHMLALSEQICNRHKLPFKDLFPLITETYQKAIETGPLKGQTGPAVRNNESILEVHRKSLEGQPELAVIYQIITQSIQKLKNG